MSDARRNSGRSSVPALSALVTAMSLMLAAASSLAPSAAYARGPDGIADVAEKVIDSVVNISTSQTVEARNSGGDSDSDSPGSGGGKGNTSAGDHR